MKIYRILTTAVVEDRIDDKQIGELCQKIDETILNMFFISNDYTVYRQDKIIDYPDISTIQDNNNVDYDKWIKKSQEIIEIDMKEMRNF